MRTHEPAKALAHGRRPFPSRQPRRSRARSYSGGEPSLQRRTQASSPSILGELHEDIGALGADKIIVIPDLDAAKFQPQREVAVVAELLNEYRPVARLHARQHDGRWRSRSPPDRKTAKASAATHVMELDSRHVAVRWSGSNALAKAPLPRFVLLAPGAVDTEAAVRRRRRDVAAAESAERRRSLPRPRA